MDDFNENNGTLSGFDEVNPQSEDKGYTVTPDGGFYTKQKQDIIQDEAFERPTAQEPAPQEPTQPEYKEYNGYKPEPQPVYQYGQYTPPPKKKKEKRGFSASTVILSVILAAVTGIAAVTAVLRINELRNPQPENVGGQGNYISINVDEEAESVVEAVAKKVTPSVVGIKTTTSALNFFGSSSESTGEGSGVVYTSDGYIITNYHVIGDAVTNKNGSKIEVFIDSTATKAYPATVVGYNISADLAVIKINVTGLVKVDIADSDKLNVGQYVITVGNPGGLEFMDSVTYGVVSGLNRVVSSDSGVELIQTDAAINPGNSGGALVNIKGELVGINSSKIVSENFENMGFAIPSNTVVKICKNIISKQNSPEPYTGITISERYSAEVLKYYGFPSGAVVLSVAEGSPAYEAGLEKGDIITEFNGKAVKEYTEFEGLISECTPGQTVSVKIYRAGRYYTANIKIASNNQVN